MKTLMTLFLTISLLGLSTLSYGHGAVDSKKIKEVSKALAKLVASSYSYKVKPSSPVNMMKELAEKHLLHDDFLYDEETSTEGDSSAWGIVKMAQAMSWLSNAEIFNDERSNHTRNSPKAKKAVDLIKSLIGTGVVFGAGPFGAVQCGFTRPALMLIDTEAGIIYTFETEGSGC